jgi:hypothetical protein
MIFAKIDYKKVSPDALQHFVKDLGWNKIKEYDDKTSVWKNDENRCVFWLPPCNSYEDFPIVVNDILASMAEATGKDVSEFSDRLIQYYNDKDLLKLRVISDDVSAGKIQIDDGTKLYESLKALISSSLRHVSGIKKEFKQLFSDDTLLGQTEIGSYVVKTYTPIISINDTSGQGEIGQIERKGLGRQIIIKLIKRLNLIIGIYKTVNDENSTTSVADKLIENGFTKKECVAIENLFGSKGHRDWELKVYWAKQLDESKPDTLVRFDHAYSYAAKKVVEYLKTVESEKSQVIVNGRVTGLERDYDEELGTVKLKAKIKAKECTVTLHLNDTDFHIAHSANASRSTIKFKGELTETKVGKRTLYEIHNIEELKLIPPSENFELDLTEF